MVKAFGYSKDEMENWTDIFTVEDGKLKEELYLRDLIDFLFNKSFKVATKENRKYRNHNLLNEAVTKHGNLIVNPMITGSGGLTLANHLGIPFTQEVIAVSSALQKEAPQTDVAIELGGEDAKIIYFEGGNIEQRMNGICAGGTGSFIDQMASLLQTDATGLNEYAKKYQSLYTITMPKRAILPKPF